jgi:hypothetical protein
MVKFKKVRIYDHAAEKAVDYLIEKELGYDIVELQNVTSVKKIKRTDDGKVRKDVDEWCAHAQLPKSLQHVVPPKALTWIAYAEWHRATKTIFFHIEPIVLKNKVECSGRTIYSGDAQNRLVRDFEISITVKMPVLGQVAESFIIEVLKNNERQDDDLCRKILKRMDGGGA